MKSVFITGGTKGIGRGLAKYYLARGYRVGICGRSLTDYQKNYSKTEQEQCKFYEVDVNEREQLINSVKDFAGTSGLDLMIANAGLRQFDKNAKLDFDFDKKIFQTNIIGVVHSFEAALKVMLNRKQGHLIAISSLASTNGFPGAAAYGASKAALNLYCESLSIDLKQFNIDVSVILPGFIQTKDGRQSKRFKLFVIDEDFAVKKITQIIDKKCVISYFPLHLTIIVKFFSFLPRFIFRWMITKPLLGFSKKTNITVNEK